MTLVQSLQTPSRSSNGGWRGGRSNPYSDRDPEAIITEEDLSLDHRRSLSRSKQVLVYEIKVADSSIFLVQAWVVDIPDPRPIITLLKYTYRSFWSVNSDFKSKLG